MKYNIFDRFEKVFNIPPHLQDVGKIKSRGGLNLLLTIVIIVCIVALLNSCLKSILPGRKKASSNFSGWFVVKITITPCNSIIPSNKFNRQDKFKEFSLLLISASR